MNSKAILIFEWNRPNYLYVCLDALSRVRRLKSWDVHVRLDGGGDSNFDWVFQKHPFVKVSKNQQRLGNARHLNKSIKDVFLLGYKEVLYYDGDVIVRTDVLDYLESVVRDAAFYSLYKMKLEPLVNWYCPLGNLITKDDWEKLNDWLQHERYVGLPLPGDRPGTLTKDAWNHDDILGAYAIAEKKPTRYADKYYSLHFGIRGMNSHLAPGIEEQMFAGAPINWMNNILSVARQIKNKAFIPGDFEYA